MRKSCVLGILGIVLAASLAGPAAAQEQAASRKPIYSTFNRDRDNLYIPWLGWTVASKVTGGEFGATYIGMPFTPAENVNVRKIVLALGQISGTNSVLVSLRADAGGVPGERLAHFEVTGMPHFGNCCETVAVHSEGIPLAAGTQYWVVAKAIGDTSAAWNVNSIGKHGTIAVRRNGEWSTDHGQFAAFKVLAD